MDLKEIYKESLSNDYEKLWDLLFTGHSFICFTFGSDFPLSISVSWSGYNPKPDVLYVKEGSLSPSDFSKSFGEENIKEKFLKYCDDNDLVYLLPKAKTASEIADLFLQQNPNFINNALSEYKSDMEKLKG